MAKTVLLATQAVPDLLVQLALLDHKDQLANPAHLAILADLDLKEMLDQMVTPELLVKMALLVHPAKFLVP